MAQKIKPPLPEVRYSSQNQFRKLTFSGRLIIPLTVLLLITLLKTNELFAQDREITSREVSTLKYKLQRNIIPEYEDLLNFISSKYTEQNEVLSVINNSLEGNDQLFENDKAVIENDMVPGADTVKSLARDMQLRDYLGNFNVSYNKSEDFGVSFSKVTEEDISPLLKSTFLYFKVFFTCTYYNTNTSGEKFYPFKRVAEVKLVWERDAWKLYIISVRFPMEKDYGEQSNVFGGIKKTNDDIEAIFAEFNNEEAKRENENKRNIGRLMEEGNDEFSKENYEQALLKYREAFSLNLSNSEAKKKLDSTRKEIDRINKAKKAAEERKQHINDLKLQLVKEIEHYDFKTAKITCDSLINDYKVDDAEIQQLSAELSQLNAALDGIETAIAGKNLKAAVKNCDSKIAEYKNKKQNYLAELYYQMAFIYFKLDSTQRKEIFKNLNNCIGISNKHQRALHMRSLMYMGDHEIINAIEDASLMIGNESRNADNYFFRAELYEKNGQKLKAIDDYAKAITYHTDDTTVFLKKAKLELDTLKYKDAIATATLGLEKTSCYGALFFIRGKAKDKLKDFPGAGTDFYKANVCGISLWDRNYIKTLSENYVVLGTTAWQQTKWVDAQNEFSKAIDIDSSNKAIYNRALVFMNIKKYEEALRDMDILVRRDPQRQDAHNQRGIILTKMERYYEAINEFELELKNYPKSLSALYGKAQCLMQQKKFTDAAAYFERAATESPCDSLWYLASLAYFNDKNYAKTIEKSKQARDKGTKKYEVYYTCGRAYYETFKYKEACKEFEQAKKLVQKDDQVDYHYALALEANQDYSEATILYKSLFASKNVKDTAKFRYAMAVIKNRSSDNYDEAMRKLNEYAGTAHADKALAYAWMAYIGLLKDNMQLALEYLNQAKAQNPENYWVHYVQACKNGAQKMAEDAIINLEKAIASGKIKKQDIEEEDFFKPIRKTDNYKKLMAKSFP